MDEFEYAVLDSVLYVTENDPIDKPLGVEVSVGKPLADRLEEEHGYTIEGETPLWEKLAQVLEKHREDLWFFRSETDQHGIPTKVFIPDGKETHIQSLLSESIEDEP